MRLLKINILAIVLFISQFGLAQKIDFFELPEGYYLDNVEVLGVKPSIYAKDLVYKDGNPIKEFNPFEEIYFVKRGGEMVEVNDTEYFGFVKNRTFYWNYDGSFYRLGISGMLSHVLVMARSYNSANGIGGSPASAYQASLVLDFKTGNSFALEPEPFQIFLAENADDLYQEFANIPKRKEKKRALFRYVIAYNNKYK